MVPNSFKARASPLMFEEATCFQAFEGMGVRGLVNGSEVVVGNRRMMSTQGKEISSALENNARFLESKGKTTIFFGWGGEVWGFFSFGDPLKPGSKETIQRIRSDQFGVWLVSGDSGRTTRAVAEELKIDQFMGQALPLDKVAVVRSLQKRGHLVGMVGDGINDAAALVQADVGFALGTGANITQEASDITILSEDPTRVIEAVELSRLTVKTIRQNLFFAICYNALGIPLAVAGLLSPLVAVLAMFAGSLTVIGNSVRILKKSRNPESIQRNSTKREIHDDQKFYIG